MDNDINTFNTIIRILVSFALGACIGAERQMRKHDAGVRTFTLICVASTLAMLISIYICQIYPNMNNGDPGRIAAQILTGVGFIGAGVILKNEDKIIGLTTAACIWITAIIGMAVGLGMYVGAVIVTVLSLFILLCLDIFKKIKK